MAHKSGTVQRLQRQVADLSSELGRIRLRTQVLIAIAGAVGEVVEDADDLVVVATDIVTCWLELDQNTRETYERNPPPLAGITWFANDYVDAVDRDAWIGVDPRQLTEKDADGTCYRAWQTHLAGIRQRAGEGQLPPPAWLTRFPLTEDPSFTP